MRVLFRRGIRRDFRADNCAFLTWSRICDPKFVTYISLNWDRNGYAPNVWFALLATAGNAVTNAALSGTASPRAMSVIAFVNSASGL
jgi:hypothetical protein